MADDTSDNGEDRPVDIDRDDLKDPTKEGVAIGNTVVDDEPEESSQEVTDDPEYEPLEPNVSDSSLALIRSRV